MVSEPSEQAVHDTIGLVYDSALDRSLWPQALEAMCRLIDGCQGSISVHDTVRREFRFTTDWTSSPDWPIWRKLLDEKYAAMMPFFGIYDQMEVGDVLNTAQMAAMINHPDDVPR
jgi:hypothetical protein